MGTVTWLRGLAEKGGKGVVNNIDARSLGRIADEIEQTRAALRQLSNEVLGSLPLMEPLCRREFGNTNYALLIARAKQAREVLGETVVDTELPG